MVAADVQSLKARIDLRDIAEKALGKYQFRSNNYLSYKCPFHGEHKGSSLAVYQDHATCFGKCNETWDTFAFYQMIYNVPFKQAIEELSGGAAAAPIHRPQREQVDSMPPNDEWQHYANQVVKRAKEILWSDEGKPAMDYLRQVRGLGPMVIDDANLGYIPGHHEQWHIWNKQWLKPDGKFVRVPAGISIPHYADKKLWAMRVRRAAGDIKYTGIPGGVKILYGVDNILPTWDLFITEGEFDCLVIDECAGDCVCPVSLCSASNHRIDSRWLHKLVAAQNVWLRVDDDEAGQRAADSLGKFTQCLRLVQVPVGKDVNEFYIKEGFRGVRTWIKEITDIENRIAFNVEALKEAGL